MTELKYFFSTDGDVGTMPSIHSFVYPKSEADAYIRKLKYKRCLAMARACELSQITLPRTYTNDINDVFEARYFWACRWRKKWLELAAKFKPEENDV